MTIYSTYFYTVLCILVRTTDARQSDSLNLYSTLSHEWLPSIIVYLQFTIMYVLAYK